MPGSQDYITIFGDDNKDLEHLNQLKTGLSELQEQIKSFSNLSVASKNVGGVSDFKKQSDDLAKGINDIAQAQGKLQEVTTVTGTKLKNLTENSEILRRALADTKSQLESLTKAGQANSEASTKLGEQVETLTVLVNQQAKGFSSLTMELRAGERALQTMRETGLQNTEGFKQMQISVANARREFNEFAKTQKILSSEAPAITALATAARGLGGAYAVGAGGAALLADGDEKVQKELTKLVAIMTVLQGLEEFNVLLRQRGAIATAIYTTAQKLWNMTALESVVATYALRGALIAATSGLLLIIPLLLQLKDNFDKAKESEKEWNEMLEAASKTAAKAIENVSDMNNEIKLAKDGILDKDRVTEHYNETIGKTTGQVKTLEEAEKALQKNAAAYIEMTLDKAIAEEAFRKSAEKTVEAEIKRMEKVNTHDIQAAAETFGLSDIQMANAVQREKDAKDAAVKEETDKANQILSIAQDYQKKAADIAKQFHFDFFGGEFELKKKKLEEIINLAKRAIVSLRAVDIQHTVGVNVTGGAEIQESVRKGFLGLSAAAADINFLNSPTLKNHEKLLDALKAIDLDNAHDRLAKGQISEIQYQEAILKIDKEYADKKKKLEIDDISQTFNKIKEYTAQAEQFIGGLINADVTRRRNALQLIENLQQKNYENEITRVNNSSLTQEQKAARMIVLEKERQTQKEANERKNRQIEQERARFEKAASIAKVIENTAEAVTKALATGVTPADRAIAAAIAAAQGAAQLAVVIATPIPQFAKGGTLQRTGAFIAGERGAELVVDPSGKMSMTPDRPTLMFGKRGTRVINNDEVNKMMLSGILRHTAQTIESDQAAKKIDELKEAIMMSSNAQISAMRKQKQVTHVHLNSDFSNHIDKYVKH